MMTADEVVKLVEGWPAEDVLDLVVALVGAVKNRTEVAQLKAEVAASEAAIDAEIAAQGKP